MGIIIFILYKIDISTLLSSFKPSQIFVIILIYTFVLSGQGIKNNQATYPFSYWGMYSNVNAPNSYLKYAITLENGNKLDYPFALVTNYSPRAFMRQMEQYSTPKNNQDIEHLKKLVISLKEIFELHYPQKEIVCFTIVRQTLPISNWDGRKSIDHDQLFTMSFSEV
jgi:energy-coupling factor transporter transmembrane protein EcfT